MLKKIQYLTLIVIIVFTGLAQAQVTTSSMSGTIADDEGEALPGANVIALHEPTGTQYGVVTRINGRFNIPNMRVGGPYTVKISFIGFETITKRNIELKLGEDYVLNVEMNSDVSQLSEVLVTGENAFVSDRTGASTSIDNETINRMPTITRSAQDIYRLNPASDGNSFAGRNNQFNNFSLDGSIFNNPFGLDAATPGGQTDAQPVSLDAIDQIQVSIAPYDITQAGFTGASVNAVTKSGTNEFHGTVFGFYRTDELTGSRVAGEEIFVPELTQLQSGFSVGGPIVKNKLFFFANLEIERRSDLGSAGWVANDGNGTTDINESRVLESDLIAVQNALSSVGYETGPYEGYTHYTENQKGIVKLDWNINQNHSLTATYNFLDAFKDKPANPFAIGRRGPDATTLQFYNSGYQIQNKIHSGVIELRSTFGSNYSNKLQAGVTAFRDSRDPFSTPAPVININRDGVRYIVAGHEPFSINNRLDQDVYQITNNFDMYKGDHTITVGASLEAFLFDNSFNLGVYDPFTYAGGTFGPGFPSVQAFVDSVNNSSYVQDAFNFAQGVNNTNNTNDSWALAETNLGQFAVYAQDKWAISKDFSFTYGVRMDMPLYFNTEEKIAENIERKGGLLADGGTYAPDIEYYDESGNPVLLDSEELPKRTPLISPRIGFNYNVNGENKLLLRGGTGLFSGRLPFVWIGNQVANPDFFFYTNTDPDFQFPQVWRTNLGIERNFDGGLGLSTDLIFTKDLNAMIVRNYGLRTPSETLSGVDNRPIYGPGDRATIFGGATNAYVFSNSTKGYSFNWIIEAKKAWDNGLFASLSYNFLETQEVSSIAAEISGDAYDRNPALGNVNNPSLSPSLYGNRHRFVLSANKRFTYSDKWATTLSIFGEYYQGGRFSYTYSGDINNDGSGLNDLIYVPTSGEIGNMQFAGTNVGEQRAALDDYISQDEYLSSIRGQYAERYAGLSPWVGKFDFRLLQDYMLDNGNLIQFSLDVLNIGNLLNSSWGVRKFPANTQPIGVSLDQNSNTATYSFDTNLENTFVNDFSLNSRWQIQLGLRYRF